MKNTKKKGFTLVELLVVIAIIAILAGASIVGYLGFTAKAKESNAVNEMAQYKTIILAELADGQYPDEGADTLKLTDKATGITSTKTTEAEKEAIIVAMLKAHEITKVTADNINLNGENDCTTDPITSIEYTPEEGITVVWTIATDEVKVK